MDWRSDANKRSIAILRVSSHRQKENTSHDIQEREIAQYCRQHGLKLVETKRIVESAKDSESRKKYSAAVNWALENGLRHILFYMFDRESRNLTDNESNEKLVRQDKIVIHYVHDGKVIHKGSSDSDWFLRDIQAVTNKQFIRNLSAKVNDAMRTKAETGWFPNNHAPLGYAHKKMRDESGRELKRGTIIVPNPDSTTVRLVQREFELRANGYSYDAIRAKIISEGLVVPTKSNPYTRSSIEKRLKNSFYRGNFDWQGITYQGKHEPIIPQHILKAVDESFSTSGTNWEKKRGVFSGGLLRCADTTCQCQITYDPKVKSIKSTGEEKLFRYYRCANSRKVHKRLAGMYATEESMWSQFQDEAKQVSIPRTFGEEVKREFCLLHERLTAAKKAEMDEFRVGLRELDAAEDRPYDDLRVGILDEAAFKRQLLRIREERFQFTDLLEAANREMDDAYLKRAEDLIELATNLENSYTSAPTPAEKIMLLKRLSSNRHIGVLEGQKLRYALRNSARVLAEMKRDWVEGTVEPKNRLIYWP